MKKAYLVTFVVTTRVVAEEQENEDKLIDNLSKKARERILIDPANYLMGDNMEYDFDEEIPYGEDPSDENSEPSVRDKIKAYLTEHGLGDRIGKNYYSCNHRAGLPSHEVMVKPDTTPIDGAHAVIITGTHVMSAVCSIPLNHHNWSVRYSAEYDTKEKMLEIVKDLAIKKEGCW